MSPDLPIRVSPRNPHLLEYHGKTTVLIASSEHYGAVINLDFDYVAYLQELAAFEQNYTRVYPGAYFETDGYFCEDNTLGPRAGRHTLPWARSQTPGWSLGGNIFDLDQWDERYFARLRDFVSRAGDLGVIVEVCLFNAMYPDMWPHMPMQTANNVQGVGTCDFDEVQSFTDEQLVRYQERYVAKIVGELVPFDNVIFEIVDEPGIYGRPEAEYGAWISRMVDVVRAAEPRQGPRHLVAQQVCGPVGGAGDFSADPRVDVATGQYVDLVGGIQLGGMRLLDSIYDNLKPIELNESTYYPGFFNQSGAAAAAGAEHKIASVRAEAWEFIVGGGAAYNHLNALYSTDNSTGVGTDNRELLAQLLQLRRFINLFDVDRMQALLPSGGFATGLFMRCSAEIGVQYAAYLHHSQLVERERYAPQPGNYVERIALLAPAGKYDVQWVEPSSGDPLAHQVLHHERGLLKVTSPQFAFDIALRIRRA